jgi:hypothetical protein
MADASAFIPQSALGCEAVFPPAFVKAWGLCPKVEEFLLKLETPKKGEPILYYATCEQEARDLRRVGFETIKCSFGPRSIGYFDHHGFSSSTNPPVALMAWEHYGSRKDKPWFAFTGAADADVVMAILLLLGQVPRDDRTRRIVDWVAKLDRDFRNDPFGECGNEDEIRLLVGYWNQQARVNGKVEGLRGGLSLFKALIEGRVSDQILVDAHLVHQGRNEIAQREIRNSESMYPFLPNHLLRIVNYSVWAPWVWLKAAPLILALDCRENRLTLVGRSDEEMTELFGKGGLLRLYPNLKPSGWGGSKSIGGPPRDYVGKATLKDAVAAAVKVSSMLLNGRR